MSGCENTQSFCLIEAKKERDRLQPHLHARLDLRELVHDWQDGLHGAATAQVRLVAHKDDGNSDGTYERWADYTDLVASNHLN